MALRPIVEWNQYVQQELTLLAKKNKEASRFVMMVTSMAKISEIDSQYRMTLSPELMQYAKIKKEVVFAGDGSIIRLWNPEKYKEVVQISNQEMPQFEDYFFQSNLK